jgi:uncharacterized protein (TIGR02453 family)
LAGLNPRKLGFRIYRDVRFSKDKRPYKVNMGAGISAHGKMEQEPGYYLHLEPGKSFVAGGIYMPDNENLAKIRQEIDYNTKGFLKILNDKKFKKLFPALGDFDKLKTAPRGIPKIIRTSIYLGIRALLYRITLRIKKLPVKISLKR